MARCRKLTRSGTAWSEADYRSAGYGTLKVRLRQEDLQLLDALSSFTKRTRTQLITSCIHSMKERAEALGLKT